MLSRSAYGRRAVAASLLTLLLAACGTDSTTTAPSQPSNPATETFAPSLGVNLAAMTKLSPDLFIQDLTLGNGPMLSATGNILRVTYTGWLVNGTQFDSNVGGTTTFAFMIGEHKVISGWELGLTNMRAGGKRRLVIGSALGYGAGGSPPRIPSNATLVFEVTVVQVQ